MPTRNGEIINNEMTAQMVLNHQTGIFSTKGSFFRKGTTVLKSTNKMANDSTVKTSTLVRLLLMMLRQFFLPSLLAPNSA